MRGGSLFTELDISTLVALKQEGHFINPKKRLLELLAGDDEADVLTTFAEKGPSTTSVSNSSR